MLTKEEREAIAERLKDSMEKDLFPDFDTIYENLFNNEIPDSTSYKEDFRVALTRIIDLCDTSNMIELPLDKDGEVIQVGDTVYIGDGIKYEVAGYMMRGNGTEVILAAGAEPVYTKEPANNITHKKPATIKSLAQRIRDVLNADDVDTTEWAYKELCSISRELESLGDSDD